MKKLQKTVLISAGPTQEPMDPVRYISNRSSGKMGYALANACIKAGHHVILVSGPTVLKRPKNCHFIAVSTAKDMEIAMTKNFSSADLVFQVAAIADYKVANPSKSKIKKTRQRLTLKLIQTPDILKKLGKMKRKSQILVGFAAETNNLLKNAQKKLVGKNLDWIVVNDVRRRDIGFDSNFNAVTLLSRCGEKKVIPKQSKIKIARLILKQVQQ